ncbi:Uncharacterized conserved protein YecE, DUF72 family [Noviherbaspirillum humi]|uniref:Uncharacterized conserved protein YecE, DUF72 family n=1 Tax=Noviherbaspirillum humi TaxID=1688639 RepID=A0A239CH38_9BURK|nr:DUF72 domain-containing protein [Noviherbaspirillum humi]SNS19182.1 Uncharacterized conserved protein YecE, DUF72 family [Noviherbaspirillum humi]
MTLPSAQAIAPILVGCAGWSLSSAVQESFPAEGTHLQRYARVLPAVEINTSFYRPHQPKTYERWRDSVPEHFRFAVKVPKAITHEARLHDIDEALLRFMGEAGALERKLGCLLVQLPPGLRFDAAAAGQFFARLRRLSAADVVCEPRHPTWFGPAAAQLLREMKVSYADADPAPAGQRLPEENGDVLYLRLHGSPRMYFSVYEPQRLRQYADQALAAARAGKRVWCIFDNTAEDAAVPNALEFLDMTGQRFALQACGDQPSSGSS